MSLIKVKKLKKYYTTGFFKKRALKAVDNVSFTISEGETLGLIGESGSGKSTVGRCLLGLSRTTEGDVVFNGTNIREFSNRRSLLAKNMQVIFQDANGSLSPRMTVKNLILEPLIVQNELDEKPLEAARRLMEMVELSPRLMNRLPHELSGGQRQRVGIARAVSTAPRFVVADEPTASLDLLVQEHILNLLKKLQIEQNISYLLISHNFQVIRKMADNIAVMYLGRLVETGSAMDILQNPQHPYTKLLLSCVPRLGASLSRPPAMLRGDMPNPFHPPKGCLFHPRCPEAKSICSLGAPDKNHVGNNHVVWCSRR